MPEHTLVYVDPDCTLDELVLELAAAEPDALPNPATGTRLVFQLIFPDLQNTSANHHSPPRFAVKDLGSVVIGRDGPGVEAPERHGKRGAVEDDGHKRLSDAKFVVGDYVSVAILHPLDNGSVAPSSVAHRESGAAARGRGEPRFRGGGSWRGDSWRAPGREGIGYFPEGDWRRGQHVPTGPRAGRSGSRW